MYLDFDENGLLCITRNNIDTIMYEILLVNKPINAIDFALLFFEHFFIITEANPEVIADSKHRKIHIFYTSFILTSS